MPVQMWFLSKTRNVGEYFSNTCKVHMDTGAKEGNNRDENKETFPCSPKGSHAVRLLELLEGTYAVRELQNIVDFGQEENEGCGVSRFILLSLCCNDVYATTTHQPPFPYLLYVHRAVAVLSAVVEVNLQVEVRLRFPLVVRARPLHRERPGPERGEPFFSDGGNQ